MIKRILTHIPIKKSFLSAVLITSLGLIFFFTLYRKFTWETGLVCLCLAFIDVLFFVFIYRRRDRLRDETFNAYFTLMIFNLSIVSLYPIIKDYKERNKIEYVYTVGFRAWKSEVVISNINIHYFDKYGNPYQVEHEKVMDSSNWNLSFVDSNYKNTWTNGTIKLRNCALIFDHKRFKSKNITNFSISADVEYINTDSSELKKVSAERYQSFQFCLRVPYKIEGRDVDKHKMSETYYGFEFFFEDFSWSKLRIPSLNYDYSEEELDYKKDNTPPDMHALKCIMKINTHILDKEADTIYNNTVKPLTKLHLNAMLLNNKASFYISKPNDPSTFPLFNFELKPPF